MWLPSSFFPTKCGLQVSHLLPRVSHVLHRVYHVFPTVSHVLPTVYHVLLDVFMFYYCNIMLYRGLPSGAPRRSPGGSLCPSGTFMFYLMFFMFYFLSVMLHRGFPFADGLGAPRLHVLPSASHVLLPRLRCFTADE